jgi:hypothetical protein
MGDNRNTANTRHMIITQSPSNKKRKLPLASRILLQPMGRVFFPHNRSGVDNTNVGLTMPIQGPIKTYIHTPISRRFRNIDYNRL